jgi:hypothetical protein
VGARGHKVKSTATNGNKKKYVSALLNAIGVLTCNKRKTQSLKVQKRSLLKLGSTHLNLSLPNAPPKHFNATQLLDAQAELVAKVKTKANELEPHKDILSMKIKLQGAKVKACKENLHESMGCQGNNKQLKKLRILPLLFSKVL